jgi:hypothetical protein
MESTDYETRTDHKLLITIAEGLERIEKILEEILQEKKEYQERTE